MNRSVVLLDVISDVKQCHGKASSLCGRFVPLVVFGRPYIILGADIPLHSCCVFISKSLRLQALA